MPGARVKFAAPDKPTLATTRYLPAVDGVNRSVLVVVEWIASVPHASALNVTAVYVAFANDVAVVWVARQLGGVRSASRLSRSCSFNSAGVTRSFSAHVRGAVQAISSLLHLEHQQRCCRGQL